MVNPEHSFNIMTPAYLLQANISDERKKGIFNSVSTDHVTTASRSVPEFDINSLMACRTNFPTIFL